MQMHTENRSQGNLLQNSSLVYIHLSFIEDKSKYLYTSSMDMLVLHIELNLDGIFDTSQGHKTLRVGWLLQSIFTVASHSQV